MRLCISYINVIVYYNYVTTMLFVAYNYNFITKFVLILSVFIFIFQVVKRTHNVK